jgi:hypothetical protein
VRVIDSYKSLFEEFGQEEYKEKWIFRGQLSRHSLSTTLERALDLAFKQSPSSRTAFAQRAEENMIREFQRWYDGENKQDLRDSLLCCLSIMQHHGAPTRLLDWTYSPYVALYFGLQYAYDKDEPFSVWATNYAALSEKARKTTDGLNDLQTEHYKICEGRGCGFIKEKLNSSLLKDREQDKCRNCDISFKSLYWAKQPLRIICPENPYRFHSRLYTQQGVSLCMGDVSTSFEDNLRSMIGQDNRAEVVKFCCRCGQSERQDALDELRMMNIHHAALFAGVDGFGRSLWYRIKYFGKPASWGSDAADKRS